MRRHTASRCSAWLGAYVQILKLSVLNFMLPNRMANARAKGMYEAAEIIRAMDNSLPAASLKYLRSLSRVSEHPNRKIQSQTWRHHLLQSLGTGSGQKSQSHRQYTSVVANLNRLALSPKHTTEFCKCMSYTKAPRHMASHGSEAGV